MAEIFTAGQHSGCYYNNVPMKTLLIMRHAKSSWDSKATTDHDRPLNERGEADAPHMGTVLKTHDLVPVRILSSTALRARRTAELVAEHSAYEGEIIYDRDIYNAGLDEFIASLSRHLDDEDSAMIVGHNPGVSELLDFLTDSPEDMPTACIAVVRLPIESWKDLDFETDGELVQLLRP